MLEERTLYRHAKWQLFLLGLIAAAVDKSSGVAEFLRCRMDALQP